MNKQEADNIFHLFPHHLYKLTNEHGLSVETIREAELFSATAQTLNQILNRKDIVCDGIVIPYHEGFSRVRVDVPIILNEREAKYLSPYGSENRLYIPKPARPLLKNPSISLYITEGEFKALKATQEGFQCIGLGGAWGFKLNGILLEDFRQIEFKNRCIVIVLDSDASFNFNVLHAGYSLALELTKLGAKVRVLVLPEVPDVPKTGLDDYLVHRGAKSFQETVNKTPHDESILELHGLSLNLLNFTNKCGFTFQCEEKRTTFIKTGLKLILESNESPYLASLYIDDNLIIKEKLNLAVGAKKESFVKRCDLGKSQTKELRQFLDFIFEFTSLQSEVTKKEIQIRREIKENFPVALSISQKKRAAALDFAKSPDLIYRVRQALEKLGLVGEALNGLLIYLALTSRLLEKPISIVIKSGSSAGKSFLVKTVLHLFPAEAYIELTGLSPKALVYLNEPFKHRFLIIYEIHGIKEDDYTEHMIRTLLSEDKIKYAVVEKNEADAHETRIIEREGPTGLITTTTFASIHDENETRLFSITVNESREQTKNIKDKIAEGYEEIQTQRNKDEMEDLINLQRILKPLPIRIPYAKLLAKLTPDEPIRMRRDFKRILAVIEAVALLHQHQRETKESNGIYYIEAKLEDYYIAKRLLEEPLNLTLRNRYPQTVGLVKAVEDIHNQKKDPVLVNELQKRFKKPKKTITRWLQPALENGWIENVGEEGQGKPFKLIPGKFEDAETNLLPSVETLLEEFPDQAQGFDAIDPLTGERIRSEEV